MMLELSTLACRGCGADLDAPRRAAARAQYSRGVMLDLACERCGKRALYALREPAHHPAAH